MSKLCLKCTKPGIRSVALNGKYYSRLCYTHYNELVAGQMPSSGSASYNRQRDLEDHLGDIQQPMLGGKINPEWTRLWPKRAREMFGEDEILAAERKN